MDSENKKSSPQLELIGYRIWLTCGNEYTYINTDKFKYLLSIQNGWLGIWINGNVLVDYQLPNIEQIEYLYNGVNYPIDTIMETDQIIKDIKRKL